MKDYYKILGVGAEASEEEIRARWIGLTKRYHPDLKKTEEGDEKIREINEAYEILKDETTRFKYDFERDLKRSFVKKAHLRREERMNIRRRIIVPSSAVLVLLLLAGFFVFRSGRVFAPQKTEALHKNETGSAAVIALQSPPVKADSKAREKIMVPDRVEEVVAPQETGKEMTPRGHNEMASLSLRRAPMVAERPSPPAARKESERKEKPVPQLVAKPEAAAIKVVSKDVPEETPERVVKNLPQETPKEVARQIPLEVSREVPKQTEVALPREVPKEVSKEALTEAPVEIPKEVIGQIPKEIPKEILKEASPQVAMEPVREAPRQLSAALPKEMPKEVTKEAPREVPKEAPKEVSQEAARVTLHPGVKLAAWAKEEKTVAYRPSLLAKENEVRQFFDSYVDRYRQKDARGFLSLFSAKAVQNQTEGVEAIHSVYTKWIDQSDELRYQIEEMKIDIYEQTVEVRARFRVDQKLKKGGAEKIWKGNIRWVLVKEGGRLKIRTLDYQNEKSR